jgi:hypothetical protein
MTELPLKVLPGGRSARYRAGGQAKPQGGELTSLQIGSKLLSGS